MPMTFYFSRYLMNQKIQWIVLLLSIVFSSLVNAATYNLTAGTYPPCIGGSGWSVSGSTYTCGGNGRVTLAGGDIITANTNVTIFADNGFSLSGNTVGTTGANINLTSNYGTITSSGTNTIFGTVNAGSGVVTLVNTSISGSLTSTGNINLTGGGVTGLVTSVGNTITTNGTNLNGGARAQSGMSITGGTLAGNFVMTSNNPITLSGVTMTSGSISGASTVTVQGGSVLGSGSSSVSISSNSGAITVNNSIVYGNLTAPSYSTVNVTNGSSIYGTCSPNSTPANACGSAPPTPMSCPAGISSGITGSYYNNRTLTEPSTATRTDAPIDFNWGNAAPGPAGIGADNFSTRWSGYIRVTQSGAYRFQTVSDDGVRLYINGNLVINNWSDHSAATDTSADVVLAAGQTYTIVLEYYENGGDAVMRLLWRLPGASSYVAIPGGPTPALGAGLYECTPVANPPVSSCPTSLSAGITGNYFNNQTLTAPVTATRRDGPINFDWGTGAPGPAGIGDNNFSVRWSGYLHVTQSGLHRFQTNSDDGVRLTVNGNLLIDQWNDHSVTVHTSAAVSLDAGKDYPITLEFYENSGYAVAQLRWQTPGSASYVVIPTGVNASPITSPGLYQCNTAAGYVISHSGTGITCAGEEIRFTAVDSSGNPVAPVNGTTLTFGTSSTVSQWVGGNTDVFDGVKKYVTKILRQPIPAIVNIDVVDNNNIRESVDPFITFSNAALKFSDIPNQVAGVVDTNPTLRAIKTDQVTGACVPQLSGNKTARLAFSCLNPTACVSGQQLTLNNLGAKANNTNVVSPLTYNSVTLSFNASGIASIPIKYTDVGQVQLHAQVDFPETTNDPAVTLMGSSNSFIVKPYTLAVSAVQRSDETNNPAGTNEAAKQFVAAGDQFKMFVEARNSEGNRTPNFGKETTSENNIKIVLQSPLTYPAGGTLTALSGSSVFVAVADNALAGRFVNSNLVWDQVGSIKVRPELGDADYLGAGNLVYFSVSDTIGRFYPHHFELSNASLVSSCSTFAYMSQPLSLDYVIQAKSTLGTTPSNYGPAYGVMPTLTHVAENNDGGVNLGARFTDGILNKVWANGIFTVSSTNAIFSRQVTTAAPDGPFSGLKIGLQLLDTFDSRNLQNLNMNASTSPVCSGAGCNAISIGSVLNMRYGRLRLDDAFGPETAILPVNFITEYWTGSFFTKNSSDNCTKILRSAITYQPTGNILIPANLTVGLTEGSKNGSTIGSYIDMTATEVRFSGGDAGQSFSAPTAGVTGNFNIRVDLASYPWLRFDWNQDGNYSDQLMPPARIGFGSYRGHDRVIYWRERF